MTRGSHRGARLEANEAPAAVSVVLLAVARVEALEREVQVGRDLLRLRLADPDLRACMEGAMRGVAGRQREAQEALPEVPRRAIR